MCCAALCAFGHPADAGASSSSYTPPPDATSATLDASIASLHAAFFDQGPYKAWQQRSGVSVLDTLMQQVDVKTSGSDWMRQLAELSLFFCLWTEAANLRHTPELLWLLWHTMKSSANFQLAQSLLLGQQPGTGSSYALQRWREPPSSAADTSTNSSSSSSAGGGGSQSPAANRKHGADAPAGAPAANGLAHGAVAAAAADDEADDVAPLPDSNGDASSHLRSGGDLSGNKDAGAGPAGPASVGAQAAQGVRPWGCRTLHRVPESKVTKLLEDGGAADAAVREHGFVRGLLLPLRDALGNAARLGALLEHGYGPYSTQVRIVQSPQRRDNRPPTFVALQQHWAMACVGAS